MSGGGAALVGIPLRDGSELRVTPEGVRTGDRLYEIERIQDARQVSPDPETIALRVAGAGLVEFQPARRGDGAVVLEAIFRLRPALRPPGFEPVHSVPPGFPPPTGAPYPPPPQGNPPYAPYPPSPPNAPYPPRGFASPPGYPPQGAPFAPAAYGPSPNSTQGELTPYPRSIGETLSAIFQLYGKHFGAWLRLGLVVVLPQVLLLGALGAVQDYVGGINPFAPISPSTTGTSSALLGANGCTLQLPSISARDLVTIGAFTGGSLLLSILFGAWQTGAFASAGREAVLGRRVRVGAGISHGTRRYVPVLAATVLTQVCGLIWIVPGTVCLALALTDLNGANICDSQALLQTHPTAATLDVVGFMLLVVGIVATLLFVVRLAFAPYVAATEPVGPFHALKRSWQLTHGSWWRIAMVLLVVLFSVGVISLVVSAVASVLPAVDLLVANPLLQLLVTPALELTYVVLLFDLRLRKEGFAAVTRAETETPVGATQPVSPPVG